MASLLDMSAIPLPAAVEELDFATLEAAWKADYVARMQQDDPTFALSVNDPAARALEVCAFREMLLRARVNDAVRGTLLASATGRQLDDLGADPAYGPTPRLIVTPEQIGPPFVAAVLETDAAYKQRLARAPHAQSVAGPAGAYEALARAAHGDIIDVAITRVAPGEILVEVLHDGDEEEVLGAVTEALNADDVRPIGDHVTIIAASHVESSIAVTVYVDDGPDLGVVQAASQARVNNLLLPKCARVRSGEALSAGEEYAFLGACAVEGVATYKVTAHTGMTPVSTAWWPMTITISALRTSGLVIELPGGGTVNPAPLLPSELINIGGGAFDLVKDWNFGTAGNIGDSASLEAEFDPYNLFNSINNGGAYGTNTVAITAENVLEGQIVDTDGRFREFTPNSMLAHVRAWEDGDGIGPASEHNGGNGSLYSKFKFPSGGSDYGKTIVWETRFRIQNPTPGQWFALWTLGSIWDNGPEMDVIEAFSAWEGLQDTAWHSDSVNGTNEIEYFGDDVTFWDGQIAAGYPQDGQNSLAQWHVITYVYRDDDTFEVWMDGIRIQHGTMTWRVPEGDDAGTSVNMQFGLDFSALHATVGDYVSLTIPADRLPITYEIDYSRIWESS